MTARNMQEWYCSEHCASADWRTHKQDCKHKGKTAPAFGPMAASKEGQEGEIPATAAAPPKAPLPAPRREFRTDGTVKIINGYKPDPNMFRGAFLLLSMMRQSRQAALLKSSHEDMHMCLHSLKRAYFLAEGSTP